MTGRASKLALVMAGVATMALPVAAQAHDGWGPGGWGPGGGWNRGGWDRGRGWHRNRGGIDGGDVLAGLLIIGGIAAVATAASNAERKRRAREEDGYRYRPEDRRRDDWRNGNQPGRAVGNLNDAVDACAAEAQRSGDIEDVYEATRSGNGYRVSGMLRSGDRFSCDVSGEGGVLLDIRRGRG